MHVSIHPKERGPAGTILAGSAEPAGPEPAFAEVSRPPCSGRAVQDPYGETASMTPFPGKSTTVSGLLTDLYQLTMAQGYFSAGMAEREAVFHLTFRTIPFGGGFAVACGLESVIEFLKRWRFSQEDVEYLRGLEGNDGKALFDNEFLDYLRSLRFRCDVDAVPEGTLIFGHEPLLRIRGPLLQCQILETPLLTLLNYQTLVATKAARIVMAAEGDPVIEFGFRRSQGLDGSLSAARAAYVGGCVGTSNVFAGQSFGVPVLGTHAHSWVMAFEDEAEAFRRYAEALPNNCVFLVDTYDSIAGVKHAIEAGRMLEKKGHKMAGIRLDSGDLASISIEARRLLDEAGFEDAKIVASNELDEFRIRELKQSGAKVQAWGVGTRLATAYDQPALDGVYKLAAIREPQNDGAWRFVIKLSEDEAKVPNPGIQQVRRFSERGKPVVDVIYDLARPPEGDWRYVAPDAPDSVKRVPGGAQGQDLLVPVLKAGEDLAGRGDIAASRRCTLDALRDLPEQYRRLEEPARYPVGLERGLSAFKRELIAEARKKLG